MSHPSRCGTDCDSTTNQHILKQCPILQGMGQTVTPLQTNTSCSNVLSFKAWDRLWLHYKPTSCSNVLSFKAWDRLWLHYKPTHPEAMSHPSRRETDCDICCDSTTAQLHGSRREWEKVAHFILQMILLVQLNTKAPSISYSQRFLY